MHKSIFRSIFSLCAAVVVSAILIIGSSLLLVAKEKYKSTVRSEITRSSAEAVTELKLSYLNEGQLVLNSAKNILKRLSAISDITYTLADSSGNVILCTDMDGHCRHAGTVYPESVIRQAKDSGTYYEFGDFDGYDNVSGFTNISKVAAGGETFYLIASEDTSELTDYLYSLMLTFVVVSAVIIVIVFPIVYLSVKRLTSPIKDMTIAAKRFGEGDFSKKVAVSEDNELGYLANTLNEMASSLEVIEETRKSFVSNVSHELKTPMTSIGGFVDGILDGTIPENRHRYYLQIVSDEVKRLARLVRSMLNIAKYETGEIAMNTENFDIVPLAIKTVLLFEKRIEDKNVEVIGLDAGRFYVNADTDLIQQVIYNLVENAVKFVNDGGYIKFSFSTEKDKTLVSIRNSGEGLTSDELPQVFDRFYKTDESRGKDKTGVGLGLSIVRSIVKLHDGTITVKSALNEYVEFIFSLNTGEAPAKKERPQQ